MTPLRNRLELKRKGRGQGIPRVRAPTVAQQLAADTPNRPQEFNNIRPVLGMAEYDRIAKKWFGYDWFAANAPQTPQTAQFDIEGARKAGYSDDEIVQHLAQSRNFDVNGAVNAGYSKQEIIQHLSSMPSSQQKELSKSQGDWFTEHAPGKFRVVEIPATTQRWERPDLNLLPPGAKLVSGSIGTRLSFPADVDAEELISTIQSQLLEPRPKFSLRASLIANRLYFLIGLAFLMAGLFSLGWFIQNVLQAKRKDAQQVG